MSNITDSILGTAPLNNAVRLALKVPVSKRKLSGLLEQAGKKQLAELMLGMNYYDFLRVQRALYEYPKPVQRKVLQEMLKASKDTEFGKKHNFDKISSISDFRKEVPVSTWEDYEEYASRLTKGESDLLFPGKATFFYRTSGTTAAFKFIPESKREAVARKLISRARNAEILLISSLGALHKIFPFFNKGGLDVTEGGIPCGTASGRTSQLTDTRLLKKLAYPPQMVEELEGEPLQYTMMRCAMAFEDVTVILGNNAKMMTNLVDFARDNAKDIISDIREGTNKYPLSDELKELISESLVSKPERADQLQRLYDQGRMIPKYYWPNLLSSCFWLGGSVGVHVDEVRKLLPDETRYIDVGYGASEAKINIPNMEDTPAGALSIFSSFYEFIPEEGGEPLLADELEDGKNYEIVLTTYAGLYRYRLKDMIHVDGFTEKTPNIYFLTKTSDVANLAQEKIPGVMLIEAIKSVAERSGFGMRTAQVYPDSSTMSYVICIETEKDVTDAESFRKTMDEGLQKELEQYGIYRGRLLSMCKLAVMKEGWLESLMKKYAKGNATAAQVKIPVVITGMPDKEWIKEVSD